MLSKLLLLLPVVAAIAPGHLKVISNGAPVLLGLRGDAE